MANEIQADETHPDYCSSDANVFIRSSDRVVFNLHSDNLKVHTNAIPFDSFSSTTNIADFGESSEVLAVLFKFLYPTPPLPSLARADTPFSLLKQVAYAAHKYQIAAAMVVADIQMELSANQDPASVLGYAYRYFNNDSRIDDIAVLTITETPECIFEELPIDGFAKWFIQGAITIKGAAASAAERKFPF